MKVIYMQQTLNIMSHGRAREVEKIIASGQVKQTQDSINYLVIEDGDSTTQQEI